PREKTFKQALETYMDQKTLAEATVLNYKHNFENLLSDLHGRTLREIGEYRDGMRALQQRIRKKNGLAQANQIVRLMLCVYGWQRKVDLTLPESPTTAVELDSLAARDWALSDHELRAWWYAVEGTKHGKIERGVKTLGPIKRAWWLTALFTGARPRSIEHLR